MTTNTSSSDTSLSPLRGRCIVVTRASEQSADLVTALIAAGANVVEAPLIEIVETSDDGHALSDAMSSLESFDWLVVTSPNGARRVAGYLVNHLAGKKEIPKVAVIGGATRDALSLQGHDAERILQSKHPSGESLVRDFPSGSGRVLLVQGERADTTVLDGLGVKGWQVIRVNGYRTKTLAPTPKDVEAILDADAMIFASGSSVRSWIDAAQHLFKGRVVVIGPVTQKVAESVGLRVDGVADEPTPEAIVAKLVELFTSP